VTAVTELTRMQQSTAAIASRKKKVTSHATSVELPIRDFFLLLAGWGAATTLVSTLVIVLLVNWSARFEIGSVRSEVATMQQTMKVLQVDYAATLRLAQARHDTMLTLRAALRRGQ
jgi:hypothetical protein